MPRGSQRRWGPRGHEASPTHLHDPAQVAVSRQLQALLLGPGLHVPELLAEDGAPVVGAKPRLGVGHQPVEQPHVDKVEELGEELDGQRGIDPATTQQGHGARERVQHVVCEGRGLVVSARSTLLDTCPSSHMPVSTALTESPSGAPKMRAVPVWNTGGFVTPAGHPADSDHIRPLDHGR